MIRRVSAVLVSVRVSMEGERIGTGPIYRFFGFQVFQISDQRERSRRRQTRFMGRFDLSFESF